VFLLSLAHTHITIKIEAFHWGICEACGFNPTLIQLIFWAFDEDENSQFKCWTN
jgi:hypothetical protein